MRPEELRALSDEELMNQLADLEEELFQLKFQRQTQELDNPLRIRRIRRDIARCKTLLQGRRMAGSGESVKETV